jgi:ProP effector
MSRESDKDVDALIAMLVEQFPRAFFAYQLRRRPLKIGVFHDLTAALGDSIDRRMLRTALHYYVQNIGYLIAQKAGADRIDLDGNPSGTVTADEAENARQRLAAIAARRKPKVEAEKPTTAARMAQEKPEEAKATVAKSAEKPPAGNAVGKPGPSQRLSLADLKAAALKRKAAAVGSLTASD